jgi:enhancing lycopene biosynthesis protein 2
MYFERLYSTDMGKRTAVILSGCGVYDGSEIHEAVFTLLAIAQLGNTYQCFAPDIDQHHVINHMTGEEMPEKRKVLLESARIARGDIKPLTTFHAADFDALFIPGGFGAAKNLTTWAFNGPEGEIDPAVAAAIRETVKAGKPVCGLCMAPTVIAKALQDNVAGTHVTVGTVAEKSPYDIGAISQGINATGAVAEMKSISEICIDAQHKIVTAPCYMMEARIDEVFQNIQQAVQAIFNLIKK